MVKVMKGFEEGDGAFFAVEESALFNLRDGQEHLAQETGFNVYDTTNLTSRRALGLVGDAIGHDFVDLDPMHNPDWKA